jgi:hypothetical protein
VGVQIFFSGALDFGTAQGPGNYRVTQRINRKKTRVVPVLSASYHSGDHTVTLLFGRSKGRASMQLTITGLRDSDGTPLSSSTIGL